MVERPPKSSDQIRAILFDFGGVLAEEGFREGLRAIAEKQGLDSEALPIEGMASVYDSGYVLGKGNEVDFWNLMRRRTGIRGADAQLRDEILSRFVLRSWILELVERLRQRGYLTAILSDQTDWLDRLNAQYHFFHAFTAIFNSYHLGKGKRDPALFDEVVRQLGVRAKEAIFVDDDPGNVMRAQARGLRAILYQDRLTFERALEAALGEAIC